MGNRARAAVTLVMLAVLAMGTATSGTATTGVAEGDLDRSFSTDGILNSDVGSVANGVAVQPNGKIDAATQSNTGGLAIVRYFSNGTLDSDFGTDGVATVSGVGLTVATDVVLQPDGKIVAVGSYFNGADYDFAVARYLANGDPDPDFGTNGAATLGLTAHNDYVLGAALAPTGKIIVAGQADNGLNYDVAVVRFTSGGAPDPTFDGDGIQTSGLTSDIDTAQDVIVRSDDSVVVVGTVGSGASSAVLLIRLLSSGGFDDSFDGDGIVAQSIGVAGEGYAEAGLAGGKILVAAQATAPMPAREIVMAQFNSNGSLDSGYGTGGLFKDDPGSSQDQPTELALQRDGKAVVVGTRTLPGSHLLVDRFTTDGALDPDFGDAGRVILPTANADGHAVAVGRDGTILAGGDSQPSTLQLLLARFVGDATPPGRSHLHRLPHFALKGPTARWPATTDDNTGVKSYDVVRRSVSYDANTIGPYSLYRSKLTHRHARLRAKPGTTTCVAVRARDWAGNVGAASQQRCFTRPLDERKLTARGTWAKRSGKAFYLRTAVVSTHRGDSLRIHAGYRRLAVVVTTCPHCGTLQVFRAHHRSATSIRLHSAKTHHHVVVPITAGNKGSRGGLIRLVQHSGGHPVIAEGLAIGLF